MDIVEYCDKHFESWGKACNFIQDLVIAKLPKEEQKDFFIRANKDVKACKGTDGIIFNGLYFDWKEFDYKKREIISAFVSYLTYSQIVKLEKGLR